jgi:hypothetical protein
MFFGPVAEKPIELSLENATALLNATISAGQLKILFAADANNVCQVLTSLKKNQMFDLFPFHFCLY